VKGFAFKVLVVVIHQPNTLFGCTKPPRGALAAPESTYKSGWGR